jgi:hypothetical protein
VNVSWLAAGPEIEWERSAHRRKKYRNGTCEVAGSNRRLR